METNIQIETIGYYHKDANMTAIPDLLPKKLNKNREYLENPNLKFPFLKLNIEVPDSGKGELKMESLLDFIRQKGWKNGIKPDFVTNKQLLAYITRSSEAITIHIFQMAGVIFMIRVEEDHPVNHNYGAVFEHFFTKTSDDEPIGNDGIVRKAVFKATIPHGNGDDSWNVLYSGAIDAIDDDHQHYEIQVLCNGLKTDFFWINKSCHSYWKSVFGNVPTLIIGSRTHKYPHDRNTRMPNNYPDLSVYEVAKLNRKDIILRAAKNPRVLWTITEGEKNLQNFLNLVKDNVKSDGDCFVFSKNDKYSEWIINRDEESVADFRDVILENIPA